MRTMKEKSNDGVMMMIMTMMMTWEREVRANLTQSDKQARSTCNQIFNKSLFLSCQQAYSNYSGCLWRELWALLACFVQLLSSLPLLKEISKDIWKNACRFQGLQSQLSWKDAEAWLRPLLAHLSYFAVPSKSCFQEGYQYFPEGTGMSTTMKNTVTSMQLASTMLPPKF